MLWLLKGVDGMFLGIAGLYLFLTLPDVLAAGARDGVGGILLRHRLLTNGTGFSPHTANPFSVSHSGD